MQNAANNFLKIMRVPVLQSEGRFCQQGPADSYRKRLYHRVGDPSYTSDCY